MTDNIPRHLIVDLLPLYFEGEVSEETALLIRSYLDDHPDVRRLVELAKESPGLQEIPAPLQKETEMEALKKSKK